MKKTLLTLGILIGLSNLSFAQQYVDILAGNGNGLRFWSGNTMYKMHMGYGFNYTFGDVTSYAIKTNMSNHSDRGWVWGVYEQAPVAAINTLGNMKLKGNFHTQGYASIGTQNPTLMNYDLNLLNTNAKISFGDNNAIGNPSGGVNCFVGEWGIGGNDTDITQMHGKNGMKFTIGNYQPGEWVAMTIGSNGNVGIGTDQLTENYKLSVEGNIRAREIEVNATTWADYVFDADYYLAPLTVVEEYIAENNHLPNVPSEEEVLEEGINLGEMDAILLRKIEELTLYMIELKKENEELKKLMEKI